MGTIAPTKLVEGGKREVEETVNVKVNVNGDGGITAKTETFPASRSGSDPDSRPSQESLKIVLRGQTP